MECQFNLDILMTVTINFLSFTFIHLELGYAPTAKARHADREIASYWKGQEKCQHMSFIEYQPKFPLANTVLTAKGETTVLTFIEKCIRHL